MKPLLTTIALIAIVLIGITPCSSIISVPNFTIPRQIILTGKILRAMPTRTEYLEYLWYEAHCGKVETAFIVLMDKERENPVIGFIHTVIPNPEGNDFVLSGDYYAWPSNDNCVKLESYDKAKAYIERYKFCRKFTKHLDNCLKCL